MSSSDRTRDNSGMDEESSGSEDTGKPDIRDIEHDDTSIEEDYPYHVFIGPDTREEAKFFRDLQDDRIQHLLEDGLTWQQKVLWILHMVRVPEFTGYDPKTYLCLPYRLCEFNMAFFDLDKECERICNIFLFIHLHWSPLLSYILF
jgi:hypothetical protein